MRRFLKVVLGAVASVVVLAALGLAVLYGLSSYQIHKTYAVVAEPVVVPTDSATVTTGMHLIGAIGKCAYCHGEDLGGRMVVDDPMLGRLYAPNLTAGEGGVATRTDADLIRAVRRGLRPDGTSLTFMPSVDFASFSDADVAAIVAYLRQVPKVNRSAPGSTLGPIGRMLVVTGKVPEMLPARFIKGSASVPAIAARPTVEYGAYLAQVGGCRGCHQPTLTGGPIPGGNPNWPPAANISHAGLARWTEADFTHALREGMRPDKSMISAVMPWQYTRAMTDDEIHAIWLYIQSLPATPATT